VLALISAFIAFGIRKMPLPAKHEHPEVAAAAANPQRL